MNRTNQKGSSTIIAVMILFFMGLMLLTTLQRQLESAVWLTGSESRYLRAYNQAASSLSWGLKQSWPIHNFSADAHTNKNGNKKWHCNTQKSHGLQACIKATSDHNSWIIKGESILSDSGQKIMLYQRVTVVSQRGRLTSQRTSHNQRVISLAHGWLDFCPEAKKDFCKT